VRLVLDTNVLLAAALVPGLCRELIQKRTHGHEFICSRALLGEFAEKLQQKFGVVPESFPLYVAYRARVGLIEAPPLPAPVCRDPDDDIVLAVAFAGEVDCIITGDRDLLVLKKYGDIRILSPRQFLELLDA